jgi:hypothetical protein
MNLTNPPIKNSTLSLKPVATVLPQSILWFDIRDDGHKRPKHVVIKQRYKQSCDRRRIPFLYASQRGVKTKDHRQNVCMSIYSTYLNDLSVWENFNYMQVLGCACKQWQQWKVTIIKNLISRLSSNHFYIAFGRSRVRFSYQTPVVITQLLWFYSVIQKGVGIIL